MIPSPNMGLAVWNLGNDPYDHVQLSSNFAKIDAHNHASAGVQIPTGGIADGAITPAKMTGGVVTPGDGTVTTAKIVDGAVTQSKISSSISIPNDWFADSASAGLNTASITRRGSSIIPTTETRTNTAYGTMPTPDQVANIVLPANGLIAVWYQASWQESVGAAGRAAIFLNGNQAKVPLANGASPVTEAAATGGNSGGTPTNVLCASPVGLVSGQQMSYSGDVTTGQILGFVGVGAGGVLAEINGVVTGVTYSSGGDAVAGGVCYLFAAAGTYTVSVQFKASSGSVTALNRRLYVEARTF